jgi:PAS domain S-box-containing protein
VDAQGYATFVALTLVGVLAVVIAWRQRAVLIELDAIKRAEQRYALVMDASDDAFWDWKVPTDDLFVSPKLLELFGLPPETKVRGRAALFERVPIPGDDRAMLDRAVAEHFAGRTARVEIEFRVVVPGGERWLQAVGRATRDPDGKVVRWVGVTRDVTARRRAEEALQASEAALRESDQRYELAMAASESGYWAWHVPSDRYFVSPRAFELNGYPPETAWANRDEYRAQINMHPEDAAQWEAAREALFAGTGERLAMEVRYIVRGETRWHSLRGICKRDDTGKVVRWTGSTTDVTERKLAEEALRESARKLRQAQRLEAMGTLAGGIAHDFNNILGAVLGYGEMALRDAPRGSRLARDLDSIMIAGERGRALVERVLAFSRNAVGERVPVHVQEVVREALDVATAKVAPTTRVHADLRAGRAAILGDATQVHQVVTNLATNALQAMPDGGTLRVELGVARFDAYRSATIGGVPSGEYVVLTVADSGGGIAPDVADRIFDPFFTTKEVGTGTGLGLALVHGIVTELGGAIDVVSSAGAGATFVVYMPRCGDATPAEDDAELALPRGDGQRVLVVDDEEPLARLASRTLEELGYAPVSFTSSAAALAAFRDDPHRFDALVTDERMPGMSGSALIHELRGMRSSLPVVLMSGYLGAKTASAPGRTTEAAQQVASSASADEVLQKPVSARDLATGLARALRR